MVWAIDLKSGSVFGEKGLDDNQKRNASVVCRTSCQFGVMMKDDYFSVLKELSMAEAERNK